MPKQMARQASGTVSEARSAGLPRTTATTRHIVAAIVTGRKRRPWPVKMAAAASTARVMPMPHGSARKHAATTARAARSRTVVCSKASRQCFLTLRTSTDDIGIMPPGPNRTRRA